MFAGLVAPGDPRAVADADTLHAVLAPYLPPDSQGTWRSGHALVVDQRRHDLPTTEDGSLPVRRGELAIAWWGRVDNRADLVARLGEGAELTDAALVLRGFEVEGESFLTALVGDFAAALIDAERNAVTLIRDPIGVKPLYVREHEGALAFASTAAALRTLSWPAPTPDREWMARKLVSLKRESPAATPYLEISQVPPGHLLTWRLGQRSRTRRWHTWRDDAPFATERADHWVEDYRAILEEAMRCRAGSRYPRAVENSGGLDSVSVLSYLGRFVDNPARDIETFGWVGWTGEPEAILFPSAQIGVAYNHLFTRHVPDAVDDGRARALRLLGHPEEHGMGGAHNLFYGIAQQRGLRTLYSGFGGDEVTTFNGSMVLTEFFDRREWRSMPSMMRGSTTGQRLRAAKHIGYEVKNLRRRYHQPFLDAWHRRWPGRLVNDEVVREYNLEHEYFESARYSAPYRAINDFIVGHLLQQTWIASRVAECSVVADSYGLDYRWPLWDVRLVQQYLSTPSIEKYGAGVGRWLHRRAIAGVVPDIVRLDPDKGMGDELYEREPHRFDRAVFDELPELVEGLVDRDRVRRLLSDPEPDVIAYGRLREIEALAAWLES